MTLDITNVVYTDASTFEWGVYSEAFLTEGLWVSTETNCHVNALELRSVF